MVAILGDVAGWLRRDGDDVDDAEDRSLFGACLDWVKVLLPALGLPVAEPDADAVMEWRELMSELTVLEARSREWPREWFAQGLEQGLERGLEEGFASERDLLGRPATRYSATPRRSDWRDSRCGGLGGGGRLDHRLRRRGGADRLLRRWPRTRFATPPRALTPADGGPSDPRIEQGCDHLYQKMLDTTA